MKKETTEITETTPAAAESWIQEAQLSPDDLDAVIGGLAKAPKVCGTYCETYSDLGNDSGAQ